MLTGMENWGLVTYTQSMFLFDSTIHSREQQITTTTSIAHEFSHQYFGNLVTPKWWSYNWLSEGIATIFEAIGTNEVCSVHFLFEEKKNIFATELHSI